MTAPLHSSKLFLGLGNPQKHHGMQWQRWSERKYWWEFSPAYTHTCKRKNALPLYRIQSCIKQTSELVIDLERMSKITVPNYAFINKCKIKGHPFPVYSAFSTHAISQYKKDTLYLQVSRS